MKSIGACGNIFWNEIAFAIKKSRGLLYIECCTVEYDNKNILVKNIYSVTLNMEQSFVEEAFVSISKLKSMTIE